MVLNLLLFLHCFKILNMCNHSNYFYFSISVTMVICFSQTYIFLFLNCLLKQNWSINTSQWYLCNFASRILNILFEMFPVYSFSVHPLKASQCLWLRSSHYSYKGVCNPVNMLVSQKKKKSHLYNLEAFFMGTFFPTITYLIMSLWIYFHIYLYITKFVNAKTK